MHVITKTGTSKALGGHAFCIVGYNEVGFLVQNSWGPEWGHKGFATLPYDDWLESGYDAWVARPGVPAIISQRAGREVSTLAGGGLALAPAADINKLAPHVVNVGNNGRLSTSGRFTSSPAQLDQIFTKMRASHEEWDAEAEAGAETPRRIVFYAHGGLNGETDGLDIAQRQLNWWLANKVYPVTFVWQTGVTETLDDQLTDLFGSRLPKAGWSFNLFEQVDRMVEKTAKKRLRWVWEEMKENAYGASDAAPPQLPRQAPQQAAGCLADGHQAEGAPCAGAQASDRGAPRGAQCRFDLPRRPDRTARCGEDPDRVVDLPRSRSPHGHLGRAGAATSPERRHPQVHDVRARSGPRARRRHRRQRGCALPQVTALPRVAGARADARGDRGPARRHGPLRQDQGQGHHVRGRPEEGRWHRCLVPGRCRPELTVRCGGTRCLRRRQRDDDLGPAPDHRPEHRQAGQRVRTPPAAPALRRPDRVGADRARGPATRDRHGRGHWNCGGRKPRGVGEAADAGHDPFRRPAGNQGLAGRRQRARRARARRLDTGRG